MFEWIDAENNPPVYQCDVIVWTFWHEKWQAMMGWYSQSVKKWRIITPNGEMDAISVSHWMPRPDGP